MDLSNGFFPTYPLPGYRAAHSERRRVTPNFVLPRPDGLLKLSRQLSAMRWSQRPKLVQDRLGSALHLRPNQAGLPKSFK